VKKSSALNPATLINTGYPKPASLDTTSAMPGLLSPMALTKEYGRTLATRGGALPRRLWGSVEPTTKKPGQKNDRNLA